MTDEKVIVREAKLDVEAIAPLFDAYRQFYNQPSNPDLAARFLRDRLQESQSTIIGAFDPGGRALGFVQLYPSFSSVSAAPILILNDLFIASDARQRGIARLLLGAAAAFGKAQNAARLTLSTELTNSKARALYESDGWTLQTEFANYDLDLRGKTNG